MADSSPVTSIIEGTVKFRDGKKVILFIFYYIFLYITAFRQRITRKGKKYIHNSIHRSNVHIVHRKDHCNSYHYHTLSKTKQKRLSIERVLVTIRLL